MPTVEEFVSNIYLLPGEDSNTGLSLQQAAIAAMESLLREATRYEDELSDLSIVSDLMYRRLTRVQRESWVEFTATHRISARDLRSQPSFAEVARSCRHAQHQ